MMEKGSQFSCERCAKTKFVAEGAKNPMPAGWTVQDGGPILCPTCTDLWNKLHNDFFAPEVKRTINLEG